jgi:hypothetical protein
VNLGEDIGLGGPSKYTKKSPIGKVLFIVVIIVVGIGIVFGIGFNSTIYQNAAPPVTTQPNAVTNHPPLANNKSVVTSMNKSITITLTANDPDLNDNLNALLVSKPSHGTLGNIDQNTGNITYTSNPGFTGTDKFTYKVNDGKTDSNSVGTISITVNGTP